MYTRPAKQGRTPDTYFDKKHLWVSEVRSITLAVALQDVVLTSSVPGIWFKKKHLRVSEVHQLCPKILSQHCERAGRRLLLKLALLVCLRLLRPSGHDCGSTVEAMFSLLSHTLLFASSWQSKVCMCLDEHSGHQSALHGLLTLSLDRCLVNAVSDAVSCLAAA